MNSRSSFPPLFLFSFLPTSFPPFLPHQIYSGKGLKTLNKQVVISCLTEIVDLKYCVPSKDTGVSRIPGQPHLIIQDSENIIKNHSIILKKLMGQFEKDLTDKTWERLRSKRNTIGE